MRRVKMLVKAAKLILARRKASLPPVPPMHPKHHGPVGKALEKFADASSRQGLKNLNHNAQVDNPNVEPK